MHVLQIGHLTITHKKDLRVIVKDLNFVLNPGDKAVLIGEEGNGKSTLLKWIFDPSLVEDYAEAEGTRAAQGAVLGYLPQELPEEEKGLTVSGFFSGKPAFHGANAAELSRGRHQCLPRPEVSRGGLRQDLPFDSRRTEGGRIQTLTICTGIQTVSPAGGLPRDDPPVF